MGLISILGAIAFALMTFMASWGPVHVTILLFVAGVGLEPANLVVGITFGTFFLSGASNCGPDSLLTGSISLWVGERLGGGRGAGATSLINGVGSLGVAQQFIRGS